MMSDPLIFDFDKNSEWGPRLTKALQVHLPEDIAAKISAAKPKYVEGAVAIVLEHGKKSEISEAITVWLKSQSVRGYHGTRISAPELASIREKGLIPLVPSQRLERLERSLASHLRWSEVVDSLPAALESYGDGRRGQVHLTISRASLVDSFDHYLTQGSEFDWHVSHHLLGEEGQALIAADGDTHLVTALVPGDRAVAAANPFGNHSEDLPNLVSDVLQVWSYWLGDQSFHAASLKVDCGMIFYETVPASWITSIE